MKKLGLIACLVFGLSGRLFSDVITPSAWVDINDGQWQPLPLVQMGPNTWGVQPDSILGNSAASIQIQELMLDGDPSISYGITVTNITGPTSYTFTFQTPVSLAAGPTLMSSSLGVTLTDGGTPEDGVQLTPFSGSSSYIQQSFVNGVDAGGDLGGLPLSSPAGFPDTNTFSYSTGPQAGPSGGASTIGITTSFTLQGPGDVATVSGRFNIIPAPEPTTWGLIIAGVACVFILQRRRNNSI